MGSLGRPREEDIDSAEASLGRQARRLRDVTWWHGLVAQTRLAREVDVPAAQVGHALAVFLYALWICVVVTLAVSLPTNLVVVLALAILVFAFFFLEAGDYGHHATLIHRCGYTGLTAAACAFHLRWRSAVSSPTDGVAGLTTRDPLGIPLTLRCCRTARGRGCAGSSGRADATRARTVPGRVIDARSSDWVKKPKTTENGRRH
jgi:hypothetical protein